MGLALISGAPLLGCLLLLAVDRVVAARAAAPTVPPACFVPRPASGDLVMQRRRRTPEDEVARTFLRVGCEPEMVDRVLARAATLEIDGPTMWLWTHTYGVTGLVLALDAGLRPEELCDHLDTGREPDWATLGVLAGLAADLGSTESCLALLHQDGPA